MQASLCPSCGALLGPRGIFCPFCAAQARCGACKEILEPHAIACVECCTRVDQGSLQSKATDGAIHASAVNTIRLEETRTSRTLEARFTDTAVESLSTPLTAYFAGGINNPARTRVRPSSRNGHQVIPEQLALLDADADVIEADIAVDSAEDQVVTSKEPDAERLRRLFKNDGNRLRLQDSRIKADSQLDFVGRLSCLFLFAHELEGRRDVSRRELNDILSESNVYDGNARKWIANTSDLLRDQNAVGLKVEGRERAKVTLDRIDDSSVAGTWKLGSSARTRTPKQVSESDSEEVSKRGRRKGSAESEKVAEWLAAWKASDGKRVDGFAILKNRSSVDKGLFGLWVIRRATQGSEKEVSRGLLAQFIRQAFEIKIDERGLERALKGSDTAKGKVIHAGGTRFQINPEGMKFVEGMIEEHESVTAPGVAANGSAPEV